MPSGDTFFGTCCWECPFSCAIVSVAQKITFMQGMITASGRCIQLRSASSGCFRLLHPHKIEKGIIYLGSAEADYLLNPTGNTIKHDCQIFSKRTWHDLQGYGIPSLGMAGVGPFLSCSALVTHIWNLWSETVRSWGHDRPSCCSPSHCYWPFPRQKQHLAAWTSLRLEIWVIDGQEYLTLLMKTFRCVLQICMRICWAKYFRLMHLAE